MTKHEAKNKQSSKTESKTYQTMLNELDEIVREVSHGKMDLDEVVTKIEHGYQLIATMRQRLDQTRAKVEKLRVDFETSSNQGNHLETTKDAKSDDDDLPF